MARKADRSFVDTTILNVPNTNEYSWYVEMSMGRSPAPPVVLPEVGPVWPTVANLCSVVATTSCRASVGGGLSPDTCGVTTDGGVSAGCMEGVAR